MWSMRHNLVGTKHWIKGGICRSIGIIIAHIDLCKSNQYLLLAYLQGTNAGYLVETLQADCTEGMVQSHTVYRMD